jgi:hypothetical protein
LSNDQSQPDPAPKPKALGLRSALSVLTRRLNKAEDIDIAELDANIRFAKNVRDDENCDVRSRLRAVEFLQAVADKGLEIAKHLDDKDRASKHEVDMLPKLYEGFDPSTVGKGAA